MVRTPLTPDERERGVALGRALQTARSGRNAAEVALRAGISLDTLRKIERGAIPTPAFFTVAALARVLEVNLAVLAAIAAKPRPDPGSGGVAKDSTSGPLAGTPDRVQGTAQVGSVVSPSAA